MRTLYRFMRNEDGASLIEYAIIIGLIAMVAIATIRTIGTSLNTALGKVTFS